MEENIYVYIYIQSCSNKAHLSPLLNVSVAMIWTIDLQVCFILSEVAVRHKSPVLSFVWVWICTTEQTKQGRKQAINDPCGEGLKADNRMMSGHWHTSWRIYFCECTFQFEKYLWKTGFGKNVGHSEFWWGVLFCFNTGFYGFYGNTSGVASGGVSNEAGLKEPVTLL